MEERKSTSSSESVKDIALGKILLKTQEIPYLLFPHFVKLQDVLGAMIKEWKLDFPKIMLLIVSDDGPLKGWSSQKQLDNFVKGLVKASNATSMWIFTSGLNIGIPKIISDAIEDDYNERLAKICLRHTEQTTEITKTPLIGLCHENILTYSDKFEDPEKLIHLVNYGNNLEEQKYNLNPFHSHFLIQKQSRKNGGGRFLLQLIDALRLSNVPQNEAEKDIFPSSPVPIIAILIQGNSNSIHYILAHLRRKLPVLIIKGSGGLADVLSYAYYEIRRSFQKIKDTDYVETVLRRGLNDKIISVFPDLKDNKMAQNLLCGRILECIELSEPPKLTHITVLSVVDLTSDMENVPYHLLQVLFKSEKYKSLPLHAQLKKDLQLTIDWNCPEIALTKVLYKDTTFRVGNDIFEQALLGEKREAFVSLFLDNGFYMYKYLRASRLIKLFEHSLKKKFFREVIWEGVLGYSKVSELDESFLDADLNWIIESLSGTSIVVSAELLNRRSMGIFDSKYPKEIAIDIANRKGIMNIFLWALLSNRSELAVVLWRHMDQPIMAALLGSLILDKMIVFINESQTQEEIAELSKKFAEMAVGVYDLCYNDMPTTAYDALNIRVEEFGGQSLIDLASLSQNRTFVAHPCCQKWLTTKFMGNIKLRDLAWGFMTFPEYIKVILCAFLIFPMYFWVRFKESAVHEFVGGTDYEDNDPYYLLQGKEEKKKVPEEEGGRSHLQKYHYPPLWQMIFWFWSAPITRFWVSNIFYIIYLAIFSLAVLWPSCGNTYLDSIICAWTCLIAVDSTYLLFALREAFPNTPLFASALEIIYMILFVIFFYLIRISNIESFQDPYAGKILIIGALLWFYYRMIFIYLPISSTLGPLLYRVKRMITVDFINYMKLVVFVLIGNGIAMQAILYPDFPLMPELVRKSFHRAFFAFFLTPTTELTMTESDCPKWNQVPQTATMCRVSDFADGTCANGMKFWPYILVFQYVLLLKLILMTVLFALFNNTGAKIGPEMDSIWKFQRYKLIVNFSNSLRLPPPLNIFSVVMMLYNCATSIFRGQATPILDKAKQEKKDDDKDDETSNFLSSTEYSYWRQLAHDYYAEKDKEKEEKSYIKKELDIISQLSYDLLYLQEPLIYRAKALITQLESDLCFTHAHLETLKYRTKKEDVSRVFTLPSLSRESPYPHTKIQRFPVPDKYVPWEVMWLHYEPPTYTLLSEKFSSVFQPYLDNDLLSQENEDLQEKQPVQQAYIWNLESVDENGVYRNRKSWITDKKNKTITYRLDANDLPRNPMGRTGLRGKGALPRWGPNHTVFAIITRWKKRKADRTDSSLMETSNHLEYVETWYLKKNDLSLPGGFVWSENKYQVIQTCFKMEVESEIWTSSEDMIKFFKDHDISSPDDDETEESFNAHLVYCGYMDDQLNTDQAWKEVELWHIHYNKLTDLYKTFRNNVRWRLLSEDVFIQLPYGQTTLLQDAIRPLNAKIAHL